MIAGCNVAVERVQELAERYGHETIADAIADVTDVTEARFRARLRELPDGTWTHRGYIEYDTVYPVVVSMTKAGDSLTFDFTETADQAPAVINCTRPACVGATIAAVLPYLCFDMPWSPAGLQRAIEVVTREGSVVHAAWPAGVSKATTTGSFMATISSSVCLAKLLAASDAHRDQFMATWMGGLYVEDVFGIDQRGEFFGAAFLDAMAGGSGARSFADGLDAGGFLDSPSSIIANVEDYEYSYPVLYLYRRIQSDTGGAGRFRGGATVSMCYVPHDVDEIPVKIMHAIGTLQPGSIGIAGGYPSCTNQFAIKRRTNVRELFARGELPSELEEIEGELEVYPESIVRTSQGHDDVYRCVAMGGAGYGDPLDREPERVHRDVVSGVVTVEHARARYGVVLAADGTGVDEAATARCRDTIRKERLAEAVPASELVADR
jgi:N-methylhydantoinase B